MKQNSLFLVGVVAVVLILALVFTSRGLRENLTGVQTLTMSDIQNVTPTYNQVAPKLLEINNSMGNTPNVLQAAILQMPQASTIYTNATSTPSKDTFMSQLSGGTYATFAAAPAVDQQIVSVLYEYFFGSSAPASSPPAPTPTPAPSTTPGTTPSSTPAPTTCVPAYKSVPGGTMEFKCFN